MPMARAIQRAASSYVSPPAGHVTDATDCDDTDPAIHPAAAESCDPLSTDEDCDGLADDADPSAIRMFLGG